MASSRRSRSLSSESELSNQYRSLTGSVSQRDRDRAESTRNTSDSLETWKWRWLAWSGWSCRGQHPRRRLPRQPVGPMDVRGRSKSGAGRGPLRLAGGVWDQKRCRVRVGSQRRSGDLVSTDSRFDGTVGCHHRYVSVEWWTARCCSSRIGRGSTNGVALLPRRRRRCA